MTLQGQLVLFHAANAPGLDHELGALAHGQPGAGLRRPGQHGSKMPQTQSEPGADTLAGGLSPVALEQELLEGLGIHDRRIAHRVDAGGDGAVDLPERDLVAQRDRGLQARAASPLQVQPRGFGGEAGTEHGFAREVPLAGVLHDGAGRHLVDAQTAQAIAFHHTPQGGREHLLIPHLRIGAVAAGERDSHAADYGNPPGCTSHQHMKPPDFPRRPSPGRGRQLGL